MPVLLRSVVAAAALILLLPAAGGAVSVPYDPFFATQATVADFGAIARPFGVAAGDYDGDGKADLVVGRVTGNVHFVKGNGDGTFQAPATYPWKQAFFNAWAFAPADLNGDGKLDVVWGANASSPSTAPFAVNDGDVRVFYGNGDGTFQQNAYSVSGVLHNAGTLLADIGTDAGSLTAGDVDGDGDADVVAGAVDGSSSVIKVLRNDGAAGFAVETLISQANSCSAPCSPIYFPATSTQNSPWGLALGDADADGDLDLFVGDRALYVYLYRNDGTGTFALHGGNSAVSGRPNVYLGHDTFRAAVGFTASLRAADLNGDAKADLALGLHSGTQTPASGTANDGVLLLDVSTTSGGHKSFGPLTDIGTMARGVSVADVNGDGNGDVLAAEYDGKVMILRQLPPIDSDGDSISDYVDNAPHHPNAARIDMNTDGAVNHRDQLDNDFDTVLGDPELASSWQRLGDPADPDDDNDAVADLVDACPFVADPGQPDADEDGIGDACDPLDGRDDDGDGVPTGPLPGNAEFERYRDAAIRWSEGATKFVLRNDALSRFFQNEFTQLMTDAATLTPEEWAVKCWENYGPGGGDPPDPCGAGEGTEAQTLTLAGGKEVPMSLVVIPRQLWTDPPVVDWINDRFQSPLLEIGQHGTDHPNNVPASDWKDDASRSWLACETCGLSEAENFQLLRLGRSMLAGDYDADKWIGERGATAASPRVDWSLAAHPLLSYAAPFNASDETSRKAMAQLGFRAFSASRFEEDGTTSYGSIFTPGGVNKHETFDEWGMFHVSADRQVDPPDADIFDGDYSAEDRVRYEDFLTSITEPGGLNTWLIEEVEWSGRACNDRRRLDDCNGSPNREDNTVYAPRWEAWLHLLDYVRSYPGGVVLTMGEVALAKAYDNAPTVANPGQADADRDGVGDAIDGAALTADAAQLARRLEGNLSATLVNGAGAAIAGQTVEFRFDADGDGTDESYVGTTNASGVATAAVTATRPVGSASFSVSWDGLRANASGGAAVTIVSATTLALADAVATRNGPAVARATLRDVDGVALAGKPVQFFAEERVRRELVWTLFATATTDSAGVASATVPLRYVTAMKRRIRADFEGDAAYLRSTATAFTYR